MKTSFLAAFVIATAPVAQAQQPAYEKTDRGIDLKIGDAQVELAAATAGAFRLSISYDGPATPNATTFLDPNAKPGPWDVATEDGQVGIKTSAGELRIDPSSGNWTLLDAQGGTIIPASPLGKLVSLPPQTPVLDVQGVDPHPKPHWVMLHVPYSGLEPDTARLDQPIQLKPGAEAKVYGCGNGAATLLQTQGDSRTANGIAVIPYYWSPSGYGVFAVTSQDEKPAGFQAQGSALVWHCLGKKADFYLMPGRTLYDAVRHYGELCGMPAVPPLWSFGYLQGKWGWKDRAFIDEAANHFVQDKLPVDAFLFDFEWYTPQNDYELIDGLPNFPDFRFNPVTFPAPAEQIAQYRAKGIHFVGIRKPRFGDVATLEMMRQKDWLLRPGLHVDIPSPLLHVGNFANPDFRAWYAAQLQPLLKENIYGWWNDEGDGGYGSFVTYYNWNLAESDAMAQARPGRRLWTLNRSFSPGLQRLGGATWTGDIQARWDVMQATPANMLNWSLSGMDYSTCDIGGYSPETAPDLLTRWMEAGVFYPVYHAHSESGRTPHFPWLWGTEAENAIRAAMDLRYQLIPYLYSLAHEAHETGAPVMRPLVMEFPDDPQAAGLTSQWLLGRGLMAAPVMSQDGRRSVYLPKDADWFQFRTGTKLSGGQTLNLTPKLDEIPVYIRAGTILPLGNVVQNTDAMPGGPLEVQVYPGQDATFTLAEDDGETTAYLNGAVKRTTFSWDDKARKLSWQSSGAYDGPHHFHDLKVVVFDPDRGASAPLAGSLDQAGSVTVP